MRLPVLLTSGLFLGACVASAGAVPVNTVAPYVTGEAAVGETLTAHAGVWAGGPVSFFYAWERCVVFSCQRVATGASYGVQGPDAGSTLRVEVTALGADGSSQTAVSATTRVVTSEGSGRLPVSAGGGSVLSLSGPRGVLSFGEIVELSGRVSGGVQRVVIRNGAGGVAARVASDASGLFRSKVGVRVGGTWTAQVEGSTGEAAATTLRVRAGLSLSRISKRAGRGSPLVAEGRLLPSSATDGKLVQLEYLVGKTWRVISQSRVRDGAFRLVYRFRQGGGYRLVVRVTVPGDRGWTYLTTSTGRTVVSVV